MKNFIRKICAQKTLLIALNFILVLNCGNVLSQEDIFPDRTWAKSNSIECDWSSEKLEEITKQAKSIGTKSLFIVQNGKVVLDWGQTSTNFHIFSARKSLLSGLYGIFSDKGVIDLSSTLGDLDIDDLPPKLTPLEKTAKIIDLLKSRSGVYHKAAYETPGMEKNRPQRGSFKPGEHWYYNNWDFNALTTIFEKQTGISVFKAFEEEIANPLMMEDFDVDKNQYHYEEQSIYPATIWYLSARDLARFGLLFLHNGRWGKDQIISQEWIEKSTTAYSDLGILGGYGLCWWVALNGEHYPFIKMPDGSYSARGTGEQTLLIIPAYDLIIVHQTEVSSPDDDIMHVVEFAKLLKNILSPILPETKKAI